MPIINRRRPRNPVAMSPLLRKGGVHQRGKSGVRGNAKQHMQHEVTEWWITSKVDHQDETDNEQASTLSQLKLNVDELAISFKRVYCLA